MQEPWKKAKEEYQNQPLPPQLDMRVKQAIAQGQSPERKVRWGLKGLISFAAAAACFTLMMQCFTGICTECGEFAGDRRISADRDGRADR